MNEGPEMRPFALAATRAAGMGEVFLFNNKPSIRRNAHR